MRGAPSATDRAYGDVRRRALTFATLSLVVVVALAAAFEAHTGMDMERAEQLDLLRQVSAAPERFRVIHLPWLVLVGVAAGTFAGLLGMGGGVVKVAGLLVVFQVDMLLARAVSLTTMLVATATAARVHIRSGAVLWQVVRAMALPSVLGAVGGLALGTLLPRSALEPIFAFFVLFLAFNMLGMIFDDPHELSLQGRYPKVLGRSRALLAAGIGGLHGFVCGLLGISGGVITLPMQQALARVPARNAVANSVVVSSICTGVGSTLAVAVGLWQQHFLLRDVLVGTLCIGSGAALGANAGAQLTGRVSPSVLKLVFTAVSLAAGASILLR